MKKIYLSLIAIVILIAALALFMFKGNDEKIQEISEENMAQINAELQREPLNEETYEWIEAELKDIRTQENFKISDFSDKPILLESFAVWCPFCTSQQRQIKKFHEEAGGSFISISLDTDPNEDENRIKQHIEKNNFDWYYAVSPPETTRSLIEQFGVEIVNAPSVPMVLLCPNGKIEKLARGVKDVDELKEAIASCS